MQALTLISSFFLSFSLFYAFFFHFFYKHLYVYIMWISTKQCILVTPMEGMNAYMHKYAYNIHTAVSAKLLEFIVVLKNRLTYKVPCSSNNKDYVSQLNSSDLHSVIFSKPHYIHHAKTLYILLSKTQYTPHLNMISLASKSQFFLI
jgi:hypothetical protein